MAYQTPGAGAGCEGGEQRTTPGRCGQAASGQPTATGAGHGPAVQRLTAGGALRACTTSAALTWCCAMPSAHATHEHAPSGGDVDGGALDRCRVASSTRTGRTEGGRAPPGSRRARLAGACSHCAAAGRGGQVGVEQLGAADRSSSRRSSAEMRPARWQRRRPRARSGPCRRPRRHPRHDAARPARRPASASPTSRSFGHFRSGRTRRRPRRTPPGRRGRPPGWRRAGGCGRRRPTVARSTETSSDAPGGASRQVRPSRPRPAVW